LIQPHVDLIIPGLLNLPAHELDVEVLQQATPGLHRLLRYARRIPATPGDFDDILLQRLGLKQAALPFAQALQEQEKGQAVLFRPVHLKADINNAIVFPIDEGSDDIDIVIGGLSEFFKQDCDIKKLPDNSWLMTLKTIRPVDGVPHYLSALGKKVTHYLEQAKSNLGWFKLFNEMQMFLHQHEINQRRQQNGQLLINSLWCWGADEYRGEKLPGSQWFSDDAGLKALGELVGAETHSLSDLETTPLKNAAIITELSLLKALKQNPDADLMALLSQLEQQCFEPLLMSKARITLHTAAGLNLHYQPRMSWQFWKKPVSMLDLQGQGR
jgi:hypothetical protein